MLPLTLFVLQVHRAHWAHNSCSCHGYLSTDIVFLLDLVSLCIFICLFEMTMGENIMFECLYVSGVHMQGEYSYIGREFENFDHLISISCKSSKDIMETTHEFMHYELYCISLHFIHLIACPSFIILSCLLIGFYPSN